MARNAINVSWILPTVMVGGLSILFCVEWRSSRNQSEWMTSQFFRSFEGYEKKAAVDSKQVQAILRSMRENLDKLSQRVSALDRDGAAAPAAPEEGEEVAAAAVEVETATVEDDLPPLPEGVEPQVVLQDVDIQEFFANPAYNPRGKIPSQVEVMRAMTEVRGAQANMEILQSQKELAIARGMESLKKAGDYVDYQPGQIPEPVAGVIGVAESTEGEGVRMFYLYPEEFPEIYELDKHAKEVAEGAFRRVLSIVNG